MFHYVNAITNTKGDALIDYYVKVVNPATGEVVNMFADENSTPIESVSEVENACKVNADGNASFYVADGEYHLDIYATDGATFVRRIEDVPMAKTGLLQAETKADVSNADTGYPVVLKLSGSQGFFIFDSSDLSLEVAADPEQNNYIAPTSDDTGASGAFVRVRDGTAVTDSVETRVVSGLGVVYTGNLDFTMSAGTYYLDGIFHNAAEQDLSLDAAHATLDRIDVLYVDSDGVFNKLTGTPAASPSKPSVDPTAQLELTFVVVPAAATSLNGVTTEDIYLENTEWTTTQSGSDFTLASTNNPYAGTKCIEVVSTFLTGAYLKFSRASNEAFGGDGNLVFHIRSKSAWNAKRQLSIQFYCDAHAVGRNIVLMNGQFGFDSTLTTLYQTVVIPKSLFSVTAATEIDELRITSAGSGNPGMAFYLDNIQLQTNGAVIGNSDLTQSIADARYVNVTGDTMTGDLVVPDEAYDATAWNGSLEVPTKNAIRDKIESITPAGGVGTTSNALTINNGGAGVASGGTFNGSAAVTISYNSVGAQPLDSELTAIAGLTSAADRLPYFTGSGTASLATFTAAGRALVDDADASAQRTTLGLGSIATFAEGTSAEYRANTSGKALSTDKVWGAAAAVALTPGTNVSVDLNSGLNFTLAMGGNYTLDNPTNAKVGQTGFIQITQDGTGSRTLAYGTNWKFAGGTDPTLSTAASAVDVLFYQVLTSTSIVANLVKAIA